MSSLKECLLGNPALWECLAEWQDDGTAVVLKELVLGAGLAVGLYHATVCLESLGQSGLVYQVPVLCKGQCSEMPLHTGWRDWPRGPRRGHRACVVCGMHHPVSLLGMSQ